MSIPKGVLLTPAEKAEKDWATAAVQNTPETLNEAFRSIITLTTALLGLSVFFFDKMPLPNWSKGIGYFFLLLSLATALYGLAPANVSGYLFLEQIREIRKSLAVRKLFCYRTSAMYLVIALALFLTGMFTLFG